MRFLSAVLLLLLAWSGVLFHAVTRATSYKSDAAGYSCAEGEDPDDCALRQQMEPGRAYRRLFGLFGRDGTLDAENVGKARESWARLRDAQCRARPGQQGFVADVIQSECWSQEQMRQSDQSKADMQLLGP